MRLMLVSALSLVPTAAFAHPGHGTEGPLHGLGHAAGSLESLLAWGVLAVVVGGGALTLAVLVRRERNRR